jgi:hypothetical protein
MSILIKGDHVRFEMTDGSMITMPDSYGIIHDPEGYSLPYCEVFFGPFEVTRQRVDLTSKAKAYFGRGYEGRRAIVDVPIQGPWEFVGETIQIFYKRRGKDTRKFYHPQKRPVRLLRCGKFYKNELPDGCVLDDRGFVWP